MSEYFKSFPPVAKERYLSKLRCLNLKEEHSGVRSRVPILSSDSCYPLGSPCFIRWEPVKSQINFPVRFAATADYTAVVSHREVDTSKLLYTSKKLFSVPTCTCTVL